MWHWLSNCLNARFTLYSLDKQYCSLIENCFNSRLHILNVYPIIYYRHHFEFDVSQSTYSITYNQMGKCILKKNKGLNFFQLFILIIPMY